MWLNGPLDEQTMRCIGVEIRDIPLDMWAEICLVRERCMVLVVVISLHSEIGSIWICGGNELSSIKCELWLSNVVMSTI